MSEGGDFDSSVLLTWGVYPPVLGIVDPSDVSLHPSKQVVNIRNLIGFLCFQGEFVWHEN